MKLLTVLLGVLFSLSTFAQEKICSQKTKVCAVYQTDTAFTTKGEGRFLLTLQGAEASLEKIDLWMQMGSHGHGSSPLKVTPTAPGEYDITKAFFVMKGGWQIRVTYKSEATTETLIIPVMIKE